MLVDSHLEDLSQFILQGLKTTKSTHLFIFYTIAHGVQIRISDGDFREQNLKAKYNCIFNYFL